MKKWAWEVFLINGVKNLDTHFELMGNSWGIVFGCEFHSNP